MTEQPSSENVERVMYRFGPWPLVPVQELVNLRQSLRHVQLHVGPTVVSELLILVDAELLRRGRLAQDEQRLRGPAGAH